MLSLEIREFLLSQMDGLAQSEFSERHPEVMETMSDPATRTAIISWLGSPEAREPAESDLVTAALFYLARPEGEEEAKVFRTFFDHTDGRVRQGAFRAVVAALFAEDEKEQLTSLLRTMLLDEADTVRSSGAGFIARTSVLDTLRPFLLEWRERAEERDWVESRSFERVTRLLEEG